MIDISWDVVFIRLKRHIYDLLEYRWSKIIPQIYVPSKSGADKETDASKTDEVYFHFNKYFQYNRNQRLHGDMIQWTFN